MEDDTLECKEGYNLSLFPVSYSLLSKQAVGLHIQHHYEIGSVVKIIRSLSENDLAAVLFLLPFGSFGSLVYVFKIRSLQAWPILMKVL